MNNEPNTKTPDINPATGLPLIDDAYIDIDGNPYGQDIYQPTYEPCYTPPSPGFDAW